MIELVGHPVEHYAELTVISLLFGGIVGAVVCGIVTAWLVTQRARNTPPCP
jgi:hypothetical protein